MTTILNTDIGRRAETIIAERAEQFAASNPRATLAQAYIAGATWSFPGFDLSADTEGSHSLEAAWAKGQADGAREREFLDIDTVTKGTAGPFEVWEGDHTAIVHVLRNARDVLGPRDTAGLADMLLRSRAVAALVVMPYWADRAGDTVAFESSAAGLVTHLDGLLGADTIQGIDQDSFASGLHPWLFAYAAKQQER